MTNDDPCVYPNCGCRNDGPNDAFRCRAMNPSSARAIVKTPYWRIDDPNGRRAIKFISEAVTFGDAPKVKPQLGPIAEATTFGSRDQAETCFTTYCQGEVLEINRVDA
jgi:hypothetical protein